MYPASFIFRVPSVAFVLLACTNLFIGIITTITVVVLENFDDEELQYIGNILKDVFLIFPQYCLGRGLMELAAEYNKNLIAGRFGKYFTTSVIHFLKYCSGFPEFLQVRRRNFKTRLPGKLSG